MKETRYFNSVFNFKSIISLKIAVSAEIVRMQIWTQSDRNEKLWKSFRLAFEIENVIRECGKWKEKDIFNAVFHIRIKVS